MKITFLLGPAGSGKTSKCLEQIREPPESEGQIIDLPGRSEMVLVSGAGLWLLQLEHR